MKNMVLLNTGSDDWVDCMKVNDKSLTIDHMCILLWTRSYHCIYLPVPLLVLPVSKIIVVFGRTHDNTTCTNTYEP
jgi:hypothetical protein